MSKMNIGKRIRVAFNAACSFFHNKVNTPKFKTQISAVVAAAVLASSIFAWGTLDGSLAWFSNNKAVKGNGMNVEVIAPETTEFEVTAYEVEENNYPTIIFSAEKIPNASIPQYEILDDTKRNLLLKIDFLGHELPVSLSATATTEAFNSVLNLEIGESNPLSYIISIAVVPAPIFDEDANTYTVSVPEDMQSFATVEDDNTVTWNKQLSLLDNTANDIYTELYILVSYNEDNIAYLNRSNFSDTEASVSFSGDFSLDLTTPSGNIKKKVS